MPITLSDSRLGKTGILGGMQLGPLGGAAAADVRETQAAFEHADYPLADVRETQAALEHIKYPPNAFWQTQACLEVLFPADWVPPTGARNYAYTGGFART